MSLSLSIARRAGAVVAASAAVIAFGVLSSPGAQAASTDSAGFQTNLNNCVANALGLPVPYTTVTQAQAAQAGPTLQCNGTLDATGATTSTTAITDLSGAQYLTGVTTLQLTDQTGLTDVGLAPISSLTGLTTLNLNGDTNVSTITSLSKLTNLNTLRLANTNVSNLSPLSGMSHLAILVLDSTPITSLAPLQNLPALATLTFRNTAINDVCVLGNRAPALTSMDATNTLVSNFSCLTPAMFPKLTQVIFNTGNEGTVSDISSLNVCTTSGQPSVFANFETLLLPSVTPGTYALPISVPSTIPFVSNVSGSSAGNWISVSGPGTQNGAAATIDVTKNQITYPGYGTYTITWNANANAAQCAAGTSPIALQYSGTATVKVGPATAPALPASNVIRLGGADRYATAALVAKQGWPNGAANVILAYGGDYPDALAATSLAGALNAPILLTDTNAIPAATAQALAALNAKNVIILGGDGVISQAIQNQLSINYNVTRLGGATRYDTAALIGNAVESGGAGYQWGVTWAPSKTMILVTGLNYADALAIAPWAGMNNEPILFANATGLPAQTSQFMNTAKINSVLAIGVVVNTPSIMAGVQAQGISAGNTQKIAGVDRYDTSVQIANTLFGAPNAANAVSVATGLNFPDALTGGAYSAQVGMPVLLLSGSGATSAEQAYVATMAYPDVYVYGGTGVIPDSFITPASN